jgi:hypothetical protein
MLNVVGAAVQTFKPLEKWKFAYPGVLEGNLTECTWSSNQKCVDPLEGEDCFKVRCEHIAVDCPPQGQDVCPHFTKISCGWMPGTTKPYWMHKCNPLAVPLPTKVTFVTCKPTPLDDGSFQCYFTQACSRRLILVLCMMAGLLCAKSSTLFVLLAMVIRPSCFNLGLSMQEGSLLGTVGMQCKVGTCLYEEVPPSPPPAVPPKPSKPHVSHPEAATIAVVSFALVLLLMSTAGLIVRDQAAIAKMRGEDVLEDEGVDESEELLTLSRCAPSSSTACQVS